MISQIQCTSFKAELYQGVHNLLADTIKMALYTELATLGASTTAYDVSLVGQVVSVGYPPGGEVVTGATVNTSGTSAYVDFSSVSFVGEFVARGALIYNASKGNKAIAVLDFGADKTSTAVFTVQMPANTVDSALIRML